MSINGIDPLPGLGNHTLGIDNSTSTAGSTGTVGSAFLEAITQGMATVETNNDKATAALQALATDSGIATHDVILAMEQAKLSLQLAAEVRQRLLDAYKELTGMQI